MGLNINLFVHGVPMGQKIWGPKGDDERYLSSFYGPKWDIPEVLKVDVMNIGGTAQCYYSFIKGRNVCDSQGRAGAYFALTVKINAFYADVQNIYNILKAVYDKMCVGLCVQEGNGTVKYMLADFKGIDGKLKEIEEQLLNYIGEFSINNDIISLAGFTPNGQAASQINLFECNKGIAIEKIRQTGHLLVSPYFPSSEAAKMIAQSKAETLEVKQQAQEREQHLKQVHQEETSRLRQQYSDTLNEKEKQYHSSLEQQKTSYENRIVEIKEQYKDADSQIEDFKRRIKQKDNEISEWKKQCESRDKDNLKLQQRLAALQNNNVEPEPNSRFAVLTRKINWRNWKLIGTLSAVIISLILALLGYFIWGTGKNEKQPNITEQHSSDMGSARSENNPADSTKKENPDKENSTKK